MLSGDAIASTDCGSPPQDATSDYLCVSRQHCRLDVYSRCHSASTFPLFRRSFSIFLARRASVFIALDFARHGLPRSLFLEMSINQRAFALSPCFSISLVTLPLPNPLTALSTSASTRAPLRSNFHLSAHHSRWLPASAPPRRPSLAPRAPERRSRRRSWTTRPPGPLPRPRSLARSQIAPFTPGTVRGGQTRRQVQSTPAA